MYNNWEISGNLLPQGHGRSQNDAFLMIFSIFRAQILLAAYSCHGKWSGLWKTCNYTLKKCSYQRGKLNALYVTWSRFLKNVIFDPYLNRNNSLRHRHIEMIFSPLFNLIIGLYRKINSSVASSFKKFKTFF